MQMELVEKRFFSLNGFIFQTRMARISIYASDFWFNTTSESITWIFFYRDKTFEDIEERLLALEEDEELSQQQKNLVCFFIFPHCASKQKQTIYIGEKSYII